MPTSIVSFTLIASLFIKENVRQCFRDLQLRDVLVQSCKQVFLSGKEEMRFFLKNREVEEESAELYRFLLQKRDEKACAAYLLEKTGLRTPGAGSLFVQDFKGEDDDLQWVNFIPADLDKSKIIKDNPQPLKNEHELFACILRRGTTGPTVKEVLRAGLAVPVVFFGKGRGLRRRLGLLRITIPVEKEIIYMIAHVEDIHALEDLSVYFARLDVPGNGIIFSLPVRVYQSNLQIQKSKRRHMASLEQVIQALDDVYHSSDWRRTHLDAGAQFRSSPRSGLRCLTLSGIEGELENLVERAMNAGASGATLLEQSLENFNSESTESHSHAFETCDLIVPADQIEKISHAIQANFQGKQQKKTMFLGSSEVHWLRAYLPDAKVAIR